MRRYTDGSARHRRPPSIIPERYLRTNAPVTVSPGLPPPAL